MAAPAAAVVAAGLIAAWSIVTPVFEAPDEPGHFRYVERLAAGEGLPVQGAGGDFDPEFSQPPLYYFCQAALARLTPAAGARVPDFGQHNPYQNATAAGNVNLFSHPASEGFPWTGQILQVHVMRLANLLFAAVTLLATYGIGIETGLGPLLALAAAASLGLLPQFDFIASALNADNAITAASAAALFLLLRGLGRPPSVRVGVLLGLVSAAAMLSKLSGLGVPLLVAAALLWQAWRARKLGYALQAAVCGGLEVVLGGWWYARNLTLYGDPLGWQPMLTAIGAMLRPRALTPVQAAAALLAQASTALGAFGWNNLRLPASIYLAAAAVVALAAGGLLRSALRGRVLDGRVVLLLAWCVVFGASLVRWVEVNTDAAQWRLLFPAFPALAVLLVLGLRGLSRWLAYAAPVGLAGLSAASLLLVVRPAYTAEAAYAGPIQHQVSVRFGDQLELVGYDDPSPRDLTPGQPVALTLYWRALRQTPWNDIVDLVALDADGQPGLKQSTWPQDGRAPTTTWRPGDIVRDRHTLDGSAHLTPGAYTLYLDVFEPVGGAPRLTLPGGGTTATLGRFLVLSPASGTAVNPKLTFGGSLGLVEYTYDNPFGFPVKPVQVKIDWVVTRPLERDLTVFVHMLDSSGKLVSQSDNQPDGGRFPTSLLPVGTHIPDDHSLPVAQLTEGFYQLEIGVYDAQTGARLQLDGTNKDSLVLPVTLGR